MDVLITLITVDADQGAVFDLYTNIDNFGTAFETDVSLASLQAGHVTDAPVDTTLIRVCGKELKCLNCVDMYLSYTTTTTTTAAIGCDETAEAGGLGVTEYTIALDVGGGEIVIDVQPLSVPDKIEILHDNVRVATSGMTVANSGPFDTLYGDPTIPTSSQALATDQFIGLSKGTPPTREAEILADTGYAYTSQKLQLVWWVYTAGDVTTNPNVIIRVTGPEGTAWNFKRLCQP